MSMAPIAGSRWKLSERQRERERMLPKIHVHFVSATAIVSVCFFMQYKSLLARCKSRMNMHGMNNIHASKKKIKFVGWAHKSSFNGVNNQAQLDLSRAWKLSFGRLARKTGIARQKEVMADHLCSPHAWKVP